jgi:hypothetical protein
MVSDKIRAVECNHTLLPIEVIYNNTTIQEVGQRCVYCQYETPIIGQ